MTEHPTHEMGTVNQLVSVLKQARREVWNDYYNLPGRGHAAFVLRLDDVLGIDSTRWLSRFAEKFPEEFKTLDLPEFSRV